MNEEMQQPNMLEEALKYASLGWSILPVKLGTKQPCVDWKKFQDKPADEQQIREWWSKYPNAGIGVVTGRVSGIVVVDIEKEGSTFGYPATVISKTGGGGFHFIFQHPGVDIHNSVKQVAPLTDIRGEGGFIVLPPSIHPSGASYEWSVSPFDADPAPLPEELLKKIKLSTTKNSKSLVEKFKGANEGSRNNDAATVIGSLLARYPQNQWESIVWPLFRAWNSNNKPPLGEKELRATFLSIANLELKKRSTQDTNKTQEQIEKPDFKITESAEILDKELKPFPYIVDRLIPENAISAITADTGKGKSLFMFVLAMHIATGKKLFNEFNVKQKRVLVIDQEMNEDLIFERYKSFTTEKIPLDYMCEQPWDITRPVDFEWLKGKILEKDYGVIIFDTWTTIHSFDENKVSEMRDLNKLFLRLIRETNITIIYLHHNRKPQAHQPITQSAARGSTEITAKVASLLMLDSYREDIPAGTFTTIKVKQAKARRPEGVKAFNVKIKYDSILHTTTAEYLGEADDNSTAVREAIDEILELFRTSKELTIKDVVEKKGIKYGIVRRAFGDLKMKGTVDSRKGEGKYWNTDYFILK